MKGKSHNPTKTKKMRKEVTIIKLGNVEKGVVNDLGDQRAKNVARSSLTLQNFRESKELEARGYL